MVVFSNHRNLRAAREAETRQARIDNNSAQRIAELQAENSSLRQKEASLRSDNTQLVKALQGKQDEIGEMERRYLEDLERIKTVVVCSMLADEAGQLWDKLRGIRLNASVPGQVDEQAVAALEKPLEDVPWPWHSRALLEFRYLYGEHQTRIGKFAPSDFKLEITSFPIPTTTKNCEEVLTLLFAHRNKLNQQVTKFSALLNYPPVSASGALTTRRVSNFWKSDIPVAN